MLIKPPSFKDFFSFCRAKASFSPISEACLRWLGCLRVSIEFLSLTKSSALLITLSVTLELRDEDLILWLMNGSLGVPAASLVVRVVLTDGKNCWIVVFIELNGFVLALLIRGCLKKGLAD